MDGRGIVVPELGLGTQPIALSMWLVKVGDRVAEGEPVVEVMADGVTIDLSAPVDGVLRKKLVGDGDAITVGQTLGVMHEDF
jgi:pyruvate/2-oxoglutarate dehydrogenase complex dihydrolipoamide acyltransferase (E2) component